MLIKAVVLIPLGCYYKAAETEWLVNIRNLFLTVLEIGESKIKVLADSVSGVGLLSGL